MPKTDPIAFFKQSLKSDAYYADELINIYLLRPIAAIVVWVLYPTSITPNQVTLMALLLGLSSAYAFFIGTPAALVAAGILIIAKDIFDDADGQLARAKQLYSRRGRFLDSIGDFIVDAAVFTAITYTVYRIHSQFEIILLGILSLIGITLRVSYHVFYQVSFLHLEQQYAFNRITEEITDEDRRGDRIALRLQQIFIVIYAWQDRMMWHIDRWCRGKKFNEQLLPAWYSDRLALRFSGLMGFGTELTILGICSMLNRLHLYLVINVLLLNTIWLINILYRKFILAPNLK
ncbi:MAG: CDP-alcohol phosphatidyltransferase family protein [Bacteroidota bacterium]